MDLVVRGIFFANAVLGNASQVTLRISFVNDVRKEQNVGVDPSDIRTTLQASMRVVF